VSPPRRRALTLTSVKPTRLLLAAAAAVTVLAGCGGTTERAAAPASPAASAGARPTIVIEHGAFADASGWRGVIGRLQRRGYRVLAPANPLRGVSADAAYLQSVLQTIDGPIVLVGHSYGGAVITNAAGGVPNVRALVYIAAVAPANRESQADIFERFPGSRLDLKTIVERPFPGGVDQYVKASAYRNVFAADVPAAATRTMAPTQRPLAKVAATEPSGPPAWQTIPSYFLVARHDHAIPPAAERFMARRARAKTVEVDSSHFVMLTHPKAVTKLILEAAGA
jgi:pimeloyl-ACP methyl ester carboxylesterase